MRCSVEVDVSSVIQNKYHSPAEWTDCRVTDSRPLKNEPCRQTYAAHGRPRLFCREHHWITMRLTAQPGPWLRPTAPLRYTLPTRQSRQTPKKVDWDKKRIQAEIPPPEEANLALSRLCMPRRCITLANRIDHRRLFVICLQIRDVISLFSSQIWFIACINAWVPFVSSSVADHALRLGSYMRRSSLKCHLHRRLWSCRMAKKI